MTNQEAIKILKSKMDGTVDTSYEWAETVRMAIKALEQKPSGDLISRDKVHEIIAVALSEYITDEERETLETLDVDVANIPTVQEPKTGHWIPTYGNVKCSVCGSVKESRRVGKATHYCDFCGAKMESEDKE